MTTFIPKGKVKRIAVIGAGSSGIAAAKEALQAGFEVTVFEQTGEIGGNWVFKEGEAHSSVYKSTFINTSRQLMCYSDFPMPEDLPTYPHHTHIVKYFYDYAKHFDVTKTIKFHTQVTKVAPNARDNTKWDITWRSSDGTPLYLAKGVSQKETMTDTFDAVMVCNGHHSVPRWPSPKFDGQDTFKGYVIHSHAYKDPTTGFDFNNKRVVVVGIGNSGVDIANELSRCAAQVYLSTRTGAWILPKFIEGKAVDQFLGSKMCRLATTLTPKWFRFSSFAAKKMQGIIEQHQGSMASWGLDPGCKIYQAHPTISHELLHRVGTGTIKIKKQIKKIHPHQVTFEDGSTVDVDAIIFCTGYHISFPFIEKSVLEINEESNQVNLFEYVFSPSLPGTLAVVGLVQPLGALMPISEMQARWITQIWLGNCGLPSKETMIKLIKERADAMAKRYIKRARHTIQVDFQEYMDGIARYIGAVPSILSNLRVLKPLLLAPVWPPQYRLNGPGKWAGAADALRTAYKQMLSTRPENQAHQHKSKSE